MSNSRKTFFIIMVIALVAVLATSVAAYKMGTRRPFNGEFDKKGFVQVTGTLKVAKLFCSSNGCKWLWTVEPTEESVVTNSDQLVLPAPEIGKIYTFDVEDSRANNYVATTPKECYEKGVTVCEYEVTIPEVVLYYTETIGSSGNPEFSAAPH